MVNAVLQVGLFMAVLFLLARPLGLYLANVYEGRPTFLDPVLRPIEGAIYRVLSVDPRSEMDWKAYAKSLLAFSGIGVLLLFAIELLQGHLPFNPQHLGAVPPILAFNTAVSFVTNTDWQAYAGENTMSYFTQMAGLTVQNFASAAAGLAVAVAMVRGLARPAAKTVGNFWVDVTRSFLWILLPLSLITSLVLVQQGVIQNLRPYAHVVTIQRDKQTLPMGPVASQEAIKELGTNGGGFFNANSAHPFENPTPLSNFVEMLAILLIPVALPLTFGRMVGDRKQGRAILISMTALFLMALAITYTAEAAGNPLIAHLNVSGPTAMEGKEVRLGIVNSALFATVTTAASCGAVNAMHDSLTPIGGMMPMLQMMFGEVTFGGVGAGLFGMLHFVILAVFIAGLMVGRTPEYLGKKIESREMKMASLAVLIPAVTILILTAIAISTRAGLSSILNPGPHGLSEILYAFTSATANNGSAFAGLNADTVFYNIALALAMLIGRFGVMLPSLAIAGSMVGKRQAPPGPGTFPTTGLLFSVILVATVLIVGALTFFPALSLGPIIEQLMMHAK